MISPTVGRAVLYHPGPYDKGVRIGEDPFAATIAHVHSDSCVNIAYVDSFGNHHARTNAFLWGGAGYPPRDQYVVLAGSSS